VDQRFRGAYIALMMEAERTSETSVHFNLTTWRYIPEESKLKLSELILIGKFYVVIKLF
jgi:hypothetical protein